MTCTTDLLTEHETPRTLGSSKLPAVAKNCLLFRLGFARDDSLGTLARILSLKLKCCSTSSGISQ